MPLDDTGMTSRLCITCSSPWGVKGGSKGLAACLLQVGSICTCACTVTLDPGRRYKRKACAYKDPEHLQDLCHVLQVFMFDVPDHKTIVAKDLGLIYRCIGLCVYICAATKSITVFYYALLIYKDICSPAFHIMNAPPAMKMTGSGH
jgi:hypothetical protein